MISTTASVKHSVEWMWNHLISPIVNVSAPSAEVKGHGLTSTK